MTPELAKRIAFTLGALLVYRIGTAIPLPGIDPHALQDILHSHRGGATLARISIFSLGLTPYISAAILMQLLAVVSSRFNAISRRGDAGRRQVSRYTFCLAAFLAVLQAFGIARAIAGIPSFVGDLGGLFVLSATLTLAGGAIFLIWLSEQITLRGVGNGLVLILCVGIVMEFAAETASMIELGRTGLLPSGGLALLAILTVGFVAVIVFVERARRLLPIVFAGRQLGERSMAPRHSHLALKLNSAGLFPAIVAGWFFYLPLTGVGLLFDAKQGWLAAVLRHMHTGQPGHMIYLAVAVTVLVLVYTAFLIDPEYAADTLRRTGATIPGVEPGEQTADHLDRVISNTTFAGAAYLVAVLLLPEALIAYGKVPYYFAGGSVLIVICAVLDIEAQVRGLSLTRRGGEYA